MKRDIVTAADKSDRCEVVWEMGDGKHYIDGQHAGNIARFINHSCDGNCQTDKWKLGSEHRVAIVASRDIDAG